MRELPSDTTTVYDIIPLAFSAINKNVTTHC